MKFKVGDKIRGISDSFKITNKAMTLAEVMSVEPLGIKIKILEHTNKSQIGKICLAITLEEHLAHFELVEGKQMSKIDELEMKVKELASEIERLKTEKENEVWKPKDGEFYWFIRGDNEAVSNKWYGDKIGEARYELGNVFRTQEEAEFRIEQIKVEAELRRFSRPFHVGEDNYTLYFSNYLNSICMVCYSDVQYGNIYFASKEIAQKAIETVGEERIKKYYFGVED